MYEIELSRKAAKFYQKADTSTVRRLNAAFDRLAEDPFHHYNIKPLSGELEGSYRLRIGDIKRLFDKQNPSQPFSGSSESDATNPPETVRLVNRS